MSDLDFFLNSGGKILGQNGVFELGRLIRAPSVPKLAYLRGNPELLRTKPSVGIIGTRKPSPTGTKRAFDYAARLSKAGCLVVSGGAIGIDYAAHRGALSVGAETLVVLGDPVFTNKDERPRRIRDLDPNNLVSTVTAFGPKTKVGRTLFVARNQYIAALSDAILIIEGTLNSGTLHTARYAQKIGTPVWVIPGDPDNHLAEAANALLEQQEARALINFQTLLKSLNIVMPSHLGALELSCQRRLASRIGQDNGLDTSMRWHDKSELHTLFQQNNGRATLDLLCSSLKLPISQIQSDLLELELMGTIQREGAEFVWQNRSLL
ncbi:MAG: DNA-processing protein DprA [Deltaproteobacteria bacterium]|nr:DNA-processing protein DprA [Deltaproteobacteria bacterium]